MDTFHNKHHKPRRPLSAPTSCNHRATTATELQEEPERYQLWVDTNFNHDHDLIKSNEVKKERLAEKNHLQSTGKILTSIFCTDMILKLFTVIFFGILPYGFRKHSKKLSYALLSIVITLLQWNCLINFIYFVIVYWTSKDYGSTIIPAEAAVIMLVLLCSAAVTHTAVVNYFYRNANVFSLRNGKGWSVIPIIQLNSSGSFGDEAHIGPNKKDWLVTNMLLLLGFSSALFLAVSDIALNMFYGFKGIHDFLPNISRPRQIQYYIALSTEFFGYGATVCSCCIFYVITRDMIRHIDYTEGVILTRARTGDDFYFYHENLHQYIEKRTESCKHWFAIHSFFFIVLVFAVLYEWLKLTTPKTMDEDYLNEFLVTQIAGSLVIAFKFAFPLISASLVTSRFTTFYFNIARKCKIQGIHDLLILSNNSGFKLYGLRINTAAAILAIISSFTSLLKLFSRFK